MSNEKISLEEARKYIENVSRRIALLHHAYSKTLVEELGESKGVELIVKVIRLYERMIGEEVKKRVLEKGLEPTLDNWNEGEDIPSFGMHEKIDYYIVDNEIRVRAYRCVLANI